MKLRRVSILMLMIFLLALSACAPASRSEAPAEGMPPAAEGGAGEGSRNDQDGFVAKPAAPGDSAAVDQRIVIRDANLMIVVDDPTLAMDTVVKMAESMGGFVVRSNIYKTSTRSGVEIPEAKITVRVPSERLNEALEQIKALVKDRSKDVRSETVRGEDVTKEFTDLNSRLKNLNETEARLREIMGSATRTEDVLAVNQQLTQIREQIEVIQGQIQYYKESAAMSAIEVTIQAQAAVQPIEVGGWRPVGVARDALQTLVDTMQFLASAAIWLLIYVLPVALVIFLPLRFLWWLFQRGRKNRKTPAAAPPTPPAPLQGA